MSKVEETTPEFEQDENQNEQTGEESQDNSSEEQKDNIDYKAEYLKQKAIKDRLAKKLEKTLNQKKEDSQDKDEVKKYDISPLDVVALSKADVNEDDFDEIIDYAKYKNISVREALKSDVLKSTIKIKQEHRQSAEATNTSTAKQGNKKISDTQLMEDFRKGKVPEAGTEEAERLFILRRSRK